MSDKKRRLIPRKLLVVPAAAVSAVVFVVLSLLGLLNFNPPSLEDASTSNEEAADVSEDAGDPASDALVTIEAPATELIPETVETVQEQATLEPLDRIDVVIDGDDYWLGIGQADSQIVREARTIGEIVVACNSSESDASGIKVRVARTFEATAQAERALLTALKEAGLDADEIDQRRTLVDKPDAKRP